MNYLDQSQSVETKYKFNPGLFTLHSIENMFLCRVSDERGTLEMSAVNEMPLKKEHLDPNVSLNRVAWTTRFHSVFF